MAQALLLALVFVSGPSGIPVGPSRIEVDLDGTVLEVFTYKPRDWRGERMIVVFHGVLRNAEEYRDHARGLGDRLSALIVAPTFDAARFPSRRYQRGGLLDAEGRAVPAGERTYALVPKLAARLRSIEGREQLRYWILGHSAGGQFVMRMAAFQDTGAERLVAANPGSDLFPVRDMDFGYGFGGLPEELASDDVLKGYLAAPLTIYLGTADDRPDEYFDGSPAASRQGGGRLQRGRACFEAGRALAASRGWPFRWWLVEVPAVGHDHQRMFDHPEVEKALFGAAEAAESRPAGPRSGM